MTQDVIRVDSCSDGSFCTNLTLLINSDFLQEIPLQSSFANMQAPIIRERIAKILGHVSPPPLPRADRMRFLEGGLQIF